MLKFIREAHFILALFFIPVQASAQESAIVKGSVFNSEDEPLAYATVAIYDAEGEELLRGTQADVDGFFEIEARPGSYQIRVSSISYHTFEDEIKLGAGEIHDFGKLILHLKTENLAAINVEAQRSQMELDFDRRIFQVGSDVTTVGGSALDVLDNIPSITTDIEGNISLRGSEGVQILINGKPSSAYGNGSGALRGLSSNMIEEVQIITNPSARYEAEGSAGIINIILKKNDDRGFHGSVTAGVGHPQDYEASVNFNYRKNNINWFLNTNLNYRFDPRESRSFQRFSSPDTSYMYRENSKSDEWEADGTVRFGADFFLTPTQILTASTTLDLEYGEDESKVRYLDMTLQDDIIQDVRRSDESIQNERDYEFEVSYENQIDGRDHRLTADFDFDYSTEKETSDLQEIVMEGTTEPLFQQTRNRESEFDYRFRADYENKFSDHSKIEAGINTSAEHLENDFKAEEFQNGEWIELNTFIDNFTYREIVNAAYSSYSTSFGNFSTQLGLRLEQTIIDTELRSSGEGSNQHYLKLFPSVFLNYAFSESQSVQASYSRRIRRPWSRMLLPYTGFTDSRNRFTGNPNLKPQFSNSFEIGFLQFWNTGSLLSSVYYRHTTDEFERITILDENGISYRFPINLSTENSWGIEFAMEQDIAEVFTLSANANFYRSGSSGTYENQDFSSSTQSFSGRMGVRWEISDRIRFQLYSRYRGPRNTTQGKRHSSTTVNTGISYEMFNRRGLLSFRVRDLFNSRNSLSVIDQEFYYSERERISVNRSFMLTFTWYFNRAADNRNSSGNRRD